MTDEGFLDPEQEAWAQRNEEKFEAVFSSHRALLLECQKVLRPLRSKSERETACLVVFAHIIEYSHAVFQLARHGMAGSTMIVLRSVVEGWFLLAAIARDEAAFRWYAETFKRVPSTTSKKFSKAFPDSPPSPPVPPVDNNVQPERMRVDELAQKAGLKAYYLSIYSILSHPVHGMSPNYVPRGDRISIGPDERTVDWLHMASSVLCLAACDLSNVFRLNLDSFWDAGSAELPKPPAQK